MIPIRSEYSGQSFRLFTDYNDVHVFVEDAGFENLYAEIFRRSELKIRKVFSKNGKASVVEAARHCSDPRCVYIVDRDWADFHKTMPSLGNLVVLEKHSIENYLIEYSGFRALVLADNPRGNIERLLSRSMFDSIAGAVSNCLRPLFECYLTMQMTQDSRPNCSISPGHFQLKNKSCAPDPKNISGFVENIGLSIPKAVRNYFAGEVLYDRGHGKYMLHFVSAGVRQAAGTRQLSHDALLIRLAQNVDYQIFANLCKRISHTAKKRSQHRQKPSV